MLPSSFRFCIDRAGAERFRGVRAVTDTRKRRARGRTARRFPRESASFAIPYERLYYPPRNGNGELAYLTDTNLPQTGIDSSWLSRVIGCNARRAEGEGKTPPRYFCRRDGKLIQLWQSRRSHSLTRPFLFKSFDKKLTPK